VLGFLKKGNKKAPEAVAPGFCCMIE